MLKCSTSLQSLTLHQLSESVLDSMGSTRINGFFDLFVYPVEYVAFYPDAGADLCQGLNPLNLWKIVNGVFLYFSKIETR